MDDNYLQVANFKKYQHRDATRRGKRGMLFIRLDVNTRDRAEFYGRGGRDRFAQWCWLLCWAGETLNKIPAAPGAWRREFGPNGSRIRDYWIEAGQLIAWDPSDPSDPSDSLDATQPEPSSSTDGTLNEQSLNTESATAEHSKSNDSAKPSGLSLVSASESASLDSDSDRDSDSDSTKAFGFSRDAGASHPCDDYGEELHDGDELFNGHRIPKAYVKALKDDLHSLVSHPSSGKYAQAELARRQRHAA